jgi:polysulfide reductase chain C
MDSVWGSVAQYQEIYWGWPIAIYLFLAGLSAGSLISALMVKWSGGNMGYSWDGLIKAGALLAPPAILIGQGLLIFDLGKPLSFYLLMMYYQLTSVMSIGVLLLLLYTPLVLLYTAMVFKSTLAEHGWSEWWFKPFLPVIEWAEDAGVWVEGIMCLSAISIATYTGFLLSALVAKPLFNIPVLPLLFLASGLSAGTAANMLVGLLLFKDSVNTQNLKYLLNLDMRIIPAELFVLFLMFTGLHYLGGNYAVVAQQALTIGVWAKVFWLGVVGIGLLLPMIVALISLHSFEQSITVSQVATPTGSANAAGSVMQNTPVSTIVFNAGFVLTGVVLLRFYVLYAGQIFTGG